MKNLSFIAAILIAFLATACKNEKQSVIPSVPVEPVNPVDILLSAHTHKLNKTWICDGYWIYSSHPSSQDPKLTYTDTTIYANKQVKINVIDDTTIQYNNIAFLYLEIDSLKGEITYSKYKIREVPANNITYYYKADSIKIYSSDYGNSFSSRTLLYSK